LWKTKVGFEKLTFLKYYGRLLRKMQKEAGNTRRERSGHERKRWSKEKGNDWDLSQMRNQDVQDFGESLRSKKVSGNL